MAGRTRWRQERRGAALLCVIASVVGMLAAFHRGIPVADLDLNDGGVWVTNVSDRLVAHLNYPSRTLDSGVRPGSGNFDVSQNGDVVVVHDNEHLSALPLDPALATLGQPLTVPKDMVLLHGGSTALIVDARGGRVWAVDAARLVGFNPASEPTVAKIPGVKAVVGFDGVAHLLTPDGKVRRISGGMGSWVVTDDKALTDFADNPSVTLTAIGDQIVAVDTVKRIVWSSSGRRTLGPGEAVVVQQPSAPSTTLALASANALLQVPLGDGEPATRPIPAAGAPTAPVVVAGCTYAAWSGSGDFVRECPGTTDDVVTTSPKLAAAKDVVFRVNRDVVVLNDTVSGDVFLADHDLTLVNNWSDISDQVKQRDKGESDTVENVTNATPGKRSERNHPPVAQPDEFGVRPGQSTTLPVLANDLDEDGDILTASVAKSPRLGRLRPVRNGGALQIDVAESMSGSGSFVYTASDGRGGEAEARVDVRVHPWAENGPPKAARASRVVLERKGEARYNILPDWSDPDGDVLTVTDAKAAAGLEVRFRPDGLITIRDLGTEPPGRREVAVTVNDGKAETEGKVAVEVKGGGNITPVANADHYRAFVGRDLVMSPLANDVDANGDTLRMVKISRPGSGASISADLVRGQVTFRATTPGTRYLDYQVTDGPSTAPGVIRVDVVKPAKDPTPFADNDLALLPAKGSVLVDVLANDDDPLGGVLVVQSVDVRPGTALAVEVVDHGLLRVAAPGGQVRRTSFTYQVSNGEASATGTVTVIPVPPKANPDPPIARDDAALVRADDIVTIAVQDNDLSPDGLALNLDPTLDVVDGADLGTFFVSEDRVRFKAGRSAGQATATYTVRDTRGNFASAQVVVSIRALDGKNAPPTPQPLTARVLAGSSVDISVPLDGIDPDGDSTQVVGLASSPAKGAAATIDGRIHYTAPQDAAGTDSFTYAVADGFGARGTAVVQVGIAPPPTVNQVPVALPDLVTARPRVDLAIPVTANDFDGDGDPITLVLTSVEPVSSQTTTVANASGDRVTLTTPDAETTLQYYYAISDGRGGQARGVLSVEVTADAPLVPPIARDDLVEPAAVLGKDRVTVPVTVNDEDPDGTAANLRVASTAPGVSVSGQDLILPVTDSRQLVVYTVTDPDKQSATAVVTIPARTAVPPTLKTEKLPVRVTAGQSVAMALSDYVRVRDGHAPRITYSRTVQAGAGWDGSDLVTNAQTITYGAAADFAGQSSVTFEVTDGSRPDDRDGLVATLTIPIEVVGRGNTPPVFHPSEITVAAGEPATVIDLRPMVTDADPGDADRLTFSLGATPPGFTVSLDGTQLRVAAPPDAEPNSAAMQRVRVTDGATDPVEATLPIRVIASTRPLMTTRDAVIEDANAGESTSVDITDYVTNPFADDGLPITLVGRPVVESGAGSVTASGTTLQITPTPGSFGQLAIGYLVADATTSVERQVRGRVLLNVRAAPEPPTAVTAESTISRTATVSWTPGQANGAPITGFTVTWEGGSKKCAVVTSCTITGLTNNQVYRFVVTATNDVGESKPSAPSNEVRPDEKPKPPGTPSVEVGDRQLSVSWAAATTEGSPVTDYVVEVSPPPSSGGEQHVGVMTSMVLTGLSNGTPYVIRVKALSGTSTEPLESEWSPASVAATPVGRPLAPLAPSVRMNDDKNLEPSATVSWNAPDGNGDDNLTYVVRNVATGQETSAGSARTLTLPLSVSERSQSFTVRASNSAGDGPSSPASDPVRAFKAPGPVSGLSAEATGVNNQARVRFTPGAANGALASELSYQWQAGSASGTLPSGGGVIDSAAFINGQNVSLTVRALAVVDGVSAYGAAAPAVVVNAFGPPGVPTVAAQGNVNDVLLSWNGSNAGNGRPITAVRIRTTDGDEQVVEVSGSRTQGSGRNLRKWIEAQVQDSQGTWGSWSGRAAANTWGDAYEETTHDYSCTYISGCRWVLVTLRQWNPGSQVYCWVGGTYGHPNWYATVTVDGNGNAGPFGGDPRLFDTAGDAIPDGRNTVECRYP